MTNIAAIKCHVYYSMLVWQVVYTQYGVSLPDPTSLDPAHRGLGTKHIRTWIKLNPTPLHVHHLTFPNSTHCNNTVLTYSRNNFVVAELKARQLIVLH